MKITENQLKILLPNNKNITEWCVSLNKILPMYGISTPKRIAMFIAQCAHESNDFSVLSENLMYRAETLLHEWPSHFPSLMIAQQYALQPEKIANRAYANRMGNGNESSGDGWKYRGRGLIQITGHDNNIKFADSLNMTVSQAIQYLLTFDGAVESGCWYWKINNINPWCDSGNVQKVTEIINGGDMGLTDRINKYNKAITIFG
jgi:putative chitinase